MMNNERNRIIDQLRRNAVALISLVIAVSSLSYNIDEMRGETLHLLESLE
jgi:hypothetical protein